MFLIKKTLILRSREVSLETAEHIIYHNVN